MADVAAETLRRRWKGRRRGKATTPEDSAAAVAASADFSRKRKACKAPPAPGTHPISVADPENPKRSHLYRPPPPPPPPLPASSVKETKRSASSTKDGNPAPPRRDPTPPRSCFRRVQSETEALTEERKTSEKRKREGGRSSGADFFLSFFLYLSLSLSGLANRGEEAWNELYIYGNVDADIFSKMKKAVCSAEGTRSGGGQARVAYVESTQIRGCFLETNRL